MAGTSEQAIDNMPFSTLFSLLKFITVSVLTLANPYCFRRRWKCLVADFPGDTELCVKKVLCIVAAQSKVFLFRMVVFFFSIFLNVFLAASHQLFGT